MVSEMVGIAGMDFVIVDQEHDPLTTETSVALCAAAERGGAAPIVRVRDNSKRRFNAPSTSVPRASKYPR